MKLLLLAITTGLAVSAATLGLGLQSATSSLLEPTRSPRQISPVAAGFPAEHRLNLAPAHSDSNTEGRTVLLNQNVINGRATIVCTDDSTFRSKLQRAIDVWAAALPAMSFTDSADNRSGPFEHYTPSAGGSTCASNSDGKDIEVLVRRVPLMSAGIYWRDDQTSPPRKLFTVSDSTIDSVYHSTEYSIVALNNGTYIG